MKINFGNYTLKIFNPQVKITSMVDRSSSVDLEFICTPEEYRSIANGCMLIYNEIPKVTIENGNQLFILTDALLSQITQTPLPGVSKEECLKLNITLYPKTIECENLIDCFIE